MEQELKKEEPMRICVNNCRALMDDLMLVYNGLRNDEISKSTAKEAANVAGKLIGAARAQLDYNKFTKCESRIPFFEA